MGVAKTVIRDLDEYQRILTEHPLVIVLFTSPYCPACLGADLRFNRIAAQYAGRVKSMILDTTQTPPIHGVSGTPTLVVYKDALEVENLKGIGDPHEQETLLEEVFKDYASPAPTAPASPVALPPPPQPGASLHARDCHRPSAGNRAGSSPTQLGSDNPRWKRH